jgi:hypothetical protein
MTLLALGSIINGFVEGRVISVVLGGVLLVVAMARIIRSLRNGARPWRP